MWVERTNNKGTKDTFIGDFGKLYRVIQYFSKILTHVHYLINQKVVCSIGKFFFLKIIIYMQNHVTNICNT